jgi:hypothetical protein
MVFTSYITPWHLPQTISIFELSTPILFRQSWTCPNHNITCHYWHTQNKMIRDHSIWIDIILVKIFITCEAIWQSYTQQKTKPEELIISKNIWKQIHDSTHEKILRKLDSAKFLINHDPEMAAGLYSYAVKEFGKLLLLKRCIFTDDECKIQYRDQFVNHKLQIRSRIWLSRKK